MRPAPTQPTILAMALERQATPCPYLPGYVADFEHYMVWRCGPAAFDLLIETGFRHFGDYFFRPACPGAAGSTWCGACLPLRVPVAEFHPSKSQRRVLRRAAEVRFELARPAFEPLKYELYRKHKERFKGRSPHVEDEEQNGKLALEHFRTSFFPSDARSWEGRYWLGERLVGVGHIDITERALSSIYFYFDPEFEALSLGTLSALREIELARERGIPHYYLGYAVHGNPAMRYKMDYRPCEIFDGEAWRPLRDAAGHFLLDPATFRCGRFTPLTGG